LLEKKIERAQRKKKGIWENGTNILTPAEYKKDIKNNKSKAPKSKGYTAKAY